MEANELGELAHALERGARVIVPAGAPVPDWDGVIEGAVTVRSRDQALSWAHALGVPARRHELLMTVVDELATNAIRAAGAVSLAARTGVGSLDVIARDHAGKLCTVALVERLVAAIRSGGEPLAPPASAGLGLYLLLRRVEWLHVEVESGVRTTVLARVPLAPRQYPFAAITIGAQPRDGSFAAGG